MEIKNMIRKMKKQTMAVSPVIATLMLVLVAVGSAGAFYAFQTEWQANIQNNAGEENVGTGTLVIGGSSTVYPFTVAAAEMYKQDHSTAFSISTGGSGAGEYGVSTGKLDIGCASHTVKIGESGDNYPYVDLDENQEADAVGEILVTQVATDAVVMVSGHDGFEDVELNESVVEDIYAINGGYTGSYTIQNPGLENGTDTTYISWTEFGDYVTGATGISGGRIKLSDRQEESGTEEVFTGKVTSFEEDGITGEQISGLTMNVSAYSNQNLVEEIAADTDVFGFMSLGIALKSDVKVPKTYQGVEPTTGNAASGDLQGARPLNMITLDMNEDGKLDAGPAKDFIEWCLVPDHNNAAAHVADYVSLYD